MKKRVLLLVMLMVVSLGCLFAQTNATEGKGTEVQVENSSSTGTEEVEAKDLSWIDQFMLENKKENPTNLLVVFVNSKEWAWAILGVLVIALLFGAIKTYQLVIKEKINAEKLYLKVRNLVRSNNIKEAISVANLVKRTTLGQIFRIGLLAFQDSQKSGKKGEKLQDEIQNAFEEASLQTLPKIDNGLSWFDLLAQVSTYLGLLGTIMGLIAAFGGLDGGGGNSQLTDGIQMSMGTTALGLIGAIIISFIKGGLTSVATKLFNDIDEYSIKLMNTIANEIKE
ncbi:MAG: hypothetical protein B6226_05065 [Candidatus Cloacimonetes bacterium 4572_65]|nr:MAG: hypothetical protein B6226_05065 [Candidatus Cloacimonetes bacterium 4572_65]